MTGLLSERDLAVITGQLRKLDAELEPEDAKSHKLDILHGYIVYLDNRGFDVAPVRAMYDRVQRDLPASEER